jgi:ATP-dependent DNA helicase RecQ
VPDPSAAQHLLTRLAGADAVLREDQATAIAELVSERRRVLLVQRTGWGKSAVYWISTALRRRAGNGPTLVVSPLLALMRDQVAAARRIGLEAETINSTNVDAWAAITERLDRDEIDVLLISPERLNAASFRPHLGALAPRLGLLVVDEAHCISDWGHEFRPDFRRIRDVLAELPPHTPVLACTATANTRVTADVATQVGADTVTLRGQLGRDSLRLAVARPPGTETRLAWLEGFVRSHRPVHGRAGIVYTLTVDDAVTTAAFLASRGVEAEAYTSRAEPEEREAIEKRLLANDVDVVVATSALGMGYDKPDLAFVVHLGAPSSPVAYYQQVGRAGRAIETAEVVLVPTAKDEAIWHHFDIASIPRQDEVDGLLAALDTEVPLSLPKLETKVNASRSRLELLLKVLDVDGAVERVKGGYVATGRGWTFDADRYRHLERQRRAEHEAMRRFCAGEVDGCLMVFLARQLDDTETGACGRCQHCSGWEPDVTVPEDAVAAARTFLRQRDVVVHPRRRWPSGLDEVSGNIPKERQAWPGRALASADGSGWAEAVASLLDVPAADEGEVAPAGAGRAPADRRTLDEVVEGIVDVLARWDWPRRPVAIVPLSEDPLLARIAERLGALGRLPVVDALTRSPGPPQREMANSAHRAANALARLEVTDRAARLPSGPVLLLDRETDSGWTLTAAAYRLSGLPPVEGVAPLVLRTGR